MATLAGRAYVSVEYDPKSISKLRRETAQHGNSIGSQLGSAGRRAGHLLAVGIGVGAVAVGYGLGKAVQSAADFQKQLNILQAVSGATAAQMKRVQSESIALGKDMKLPATSASDAALAMTELAKGGLSVRDSMKAARGSLELAVAGQTDVATAASITATSLNQFSLDGSRATHVADLLAGAANASAGSVTDFAEGLRYAGTAGHAAGQSIDTVVAALAEMANKGLQGSVAGSSLAQAFRSLQAPTAKAQSALDKYNLSIYDSAGKTKPLIEIADQFQQKLGQLTEKQQNATLAQIFGTRAVQAARVVLLGGGDALQKYVDKVGQSGNAQRLAAAQMKGFSGAIQGFTSNIETLGIQLGLVLLPAATKVVRVLSDMATVIGNIAAAPSVSVAIKIAWQGVGKVYDSLKAALFGEVSALGSQGLSRQAAHGIQLPVQIDKKGLVPRLSAALGGAVAAVDWTTVGASIANGIGSAITFTSKTAGKMVTTLTAAIAAHHNEIADAGAKIAAELVANLLDPGFWKANWRTTFAIALTFLGPAKWGKVGGEIAKFFGEGFVKIIGKLIPDAVRASFTVGRGIIVRVLRRAALEGALVLDRIFTKLPGVAQRVFGRVAATGIALFRGLASRVASDLTGLIGNAIDRVGRKIQSSLVGRTLMWLGKFALIRGAIDGIASAFQFVIDKIKEAIGWVENLAGKIASIHIPGSGVIGAIGGALHIPHTGGIVTPTGMTGYAMGGLAIGGISGRDSVPALLTPGELVLNRHQQEALLHGGGGGDLYLEVQIGNEAVDPHLVRVVRHENKQTARRVKAGRKW